MIEIRKAVLIAVVASGAALLAGCGPNGPKGDRGLPPPPENLAYPNLGATPGDARRPLKSPGEQERLKADLLAGKRQR